MEGKQEQSAIIETLKELENFLKTKGFERLAEIKKANPTYADRLTEVYVDCIEKAITFLTSDK